MALTAILSKPNLGNLMSGLLHPVLPTDTTSYSPWLVIMGILAATMGSISSIRYSAAVLEKGWRSPAFLRQQRIDLVLSLLGMFTIFALMQIAAAGALQPRGIHVKRLILHRSSALCSEAGESSYSERLSGVSRSPARSPPIQPTESFQVTTEDYHLRPSSECPWTTPPKTQTQCYPKLALSLEAEVSRLLPRSHFLSF